MYGLHKVTFKTVCTCMLLSIAFCWSILPFHVTLVYRGACVRMKHIISFLPFLLLRAAAAAAALLHF